MSGPAWWQSFERLDAIYRGARGVAIASLTIALASWIAAVPVVAVPAVIAGTTAVLVTLFAWFRRDDLARARGSQS